MNLYAGRLGLGVEKFLAWLQGKGENEVVGTAQCYDSAIARFAEAQTGSPLCEYELGFLSVWDLADPDKNGSDEYREEHGPMVRVPAWAEELEDELERRYPEVQDLTARQVLNALLGLQMEKVL